ncbi:hypothetical protein [Duncaniella muris]|uniref:hypothetical protein n=1 Tax=Duncaniella muris TaxID=2094150 RepID=UPI003F67B443
MAPADYKVKFKELKSRVGIDDVAYSLGTTLDAQAGVGRYIELVLARDATSVTPSSSATAGTRLRRLSSGGRLKGDVCRSYARTFSSFNVIGLTNGRR